MIIKQTTNPEVFALAVDFAYRILKRPHALNLTVRRPHEYIACRMFLSEDARAGFAIDDCELVNVFSFKHKQGGLLIQRAIGAGARRLNCFDGALPPLYAKHGFVETRRCVWDRRFAPKEWNERLWGTPDVVHMELLNA